MLLQCELLVCLQWLSPPAFVCTLPARQIVVRIVCMRNKGHSCSCSFAWNRAPTRLHKRRKKGTRTLTSRWSQHVRYEYSWWTGWQSVRGQVCRPSCSPVPERSEMPCTPQPAPAKSLIPSVSDNFVPCICPADSLSCTCCKMYSVPLPLPGAPAALGVAAQKGEEERKAGVGSSEPQNDVSPAGHSLQGSVAPSSPSSCASSCKLRVCVSLCLCFCARACLPQRRAAPRPPGGHCSRHTPTWRCSTPWLHAAC